MIIRAIREPSLTLTEHTNALWYINGEIQQAGIAAILLTQLEHLHVYTHELQNNTAKYIQG